MKIFASLSEDERLFAHLSHVYRLACKYYYEGLTEDDLDNETALAIMNCLGSDKSIKQGGIHYYNYMFPEKYEKEKDVTYRQDIHYDNSGNIFAQLSLREALERYGSADLGEFTIPADIADYVKTAYENGEFGSKNIPEDKERYEEALEVVTGLVEKYDVPSQSAIAVIGALWVECGWAFKQAIVNTQERDGGGLEGTGGWKNAGECWFGLTFWEQKKKVIAATKAPVAGEATYNNNDAVHLANLDWDWQLKILYTYFEKINTKWGDILLDPNGDPGEQICASYIFKAGFGKEPTLAEAIRTTKIYMESHKRVNKIANPINGFACQVFISAKFALWIKNKDEGKDEIPSNDEVINSL